MKVLVLALSLLLASCGRKEAAPDLAVNTGQGFQLVNTYPRALDQSRVLFQWARFR